MKFSERTLRISAASVLALLMVGSSYVLSGPNIFTSKFANAGTTDELLKAYAAKDTDSDELPDWQEALYGTDPNKAISNSFGIPDGQAAREGKLTQNSLASLLPADTTTSTSTEDILSEVPGIDPAPGSITDEFSKEFFQQYMQKSGGRQLDAETEQKLVTDLLSNITVKAKGKLSSSYTQVSIHTNSTVTVSQYASTIEDIFRAHDVSAEANEPIPLMEALIQKNDESARKKLQLLSDSYGAITTDLLAAQVPPRLAVQHLALIRGFDELHKATALVVTYEKDPLGVMGALSTYQPSSASIVTAFKGIATIILSTGEPAAGQPGAMIVSVARSAEPQ